MQLALDVIRLPPFEALGRSGARPYEDEDDKHGGVPPRAMRVDFMADYRVYDRGRTPFTARPTDK